MTFLYINTALQRTSYKPTNQITRYITIRDLLTVQRLSRTLPCISRGLVNVDKFLYVLIRSAQTKHKTFINIKHNTSSSGEGLLPRSSTNQSTGKGRKNIFFQKQVEYGINYSMLNLKRNVNNICMQGISCLAICRKSQYIFVVLKLNTK